MRVLVDQDAKPPKGVMLSSIGDSTEVDDQNDKKGTGTDLREEVVTIVCKEEKIIQWSRSKLANLSEYFRVLLYGNFRESALERIEFRQVNGNLLKIALDFYEHHQCKNLGHDDAAFSRIFIRDFQSAWDLIEIADMFGLEEASLECEKYLSQTLASYNLLQICSLAEIFSRHSLQREAVRNWIVQGEEKCECDAASSDQTQCLCVYSRRYRKTNRFYIIGGYCYEYFRDCNSIDSSKFLRTTEAETLQPNTTTSQKSRICSITDVKLPNQWCQRQAYSGPHNEECRIVALGTDIYATGGFDHKARVRGEVWKYDTRNDSWMRVSDMRSGRFYHCIASVGTHIYVCGGYNDNFVLDSLERYHPNYNEWVELAKMPIGVGNAAYTSDENGIYVACGQYGYKEIQTTNLVQHYAITTDQWSILTSYESPVFFPHSEYGLSSAIVEGKLIIVGGQTERCDAFDLKEKQWTRISNMNCRRMESSVFTYQGKLYAAGGYDYRTGEYHDTVEVYDVEQNQWKILSSKLPRPARSFGLCYIFDVEEKTVR